MIVAINPLREAGLLKFNNPQKPGGMLGHGTDLADHFLQVRSDGDLALWQALGHLLLQRGVADEVFIAEHTVGFDAWAEHLREIDRDEVIAATGLAWAEIEQLADVFAMVLQTMRSHDQFQHHHLRPRPTATAASTTAAASCSSPQPT